MIIATGRFDAHSSHKSVNQETRKKKTKKPAAEHDWLFS